MSLSTVLIVAALLATVYSLVCGVTSMVRGAPVQHHSSQEWMVRRVAFQALAVGLLLVAVFTQ